MDAEVIEVDMERRQRNRGSYTHCSDDGEENLTENSSVGGMSNEVDDRSEKPYVGMEFESEEAAKNLYDAYARRVGFSTHVGQYIRTKPDGPIVSWEFACSREVFKRKNVESCNAMLRIDRKDPDIWVVTKFVEDHNHSTVSPSKVHYLRPRRHFAGTTKSVPETADNQNDIMVSVDGNHVFYDPNPVVVMPLQFIQPSSRRRTLGRDAQNLLTYFRKMQAENPGFYYAIQLDDENRLSNVFWADARSRTAYSHFGDAVVFDTMYRPNQFQKQWAPVYFRDTFFAALSSNHGVSSFFDGYVNQQTTIPMFFKQYERALENSLEREIEADCDTMCTTPVLKTPSPMEQQAANLYTKKVFAKFQEELVETFVYTANKIDGDGTVSKFRVAKYEHDHKAYIVMLDVSGMNASCSCQMFEYSGVLCRHILTVFTVTNVLTIPSHYILKRWTRNARTSLSDEQEIDMQCMESLTVRFNNLCREAIKFAEVGAIAAETYNAAMDVLQEGARKISMVKKNVTKIKSPSSQGSGSFQDNSSKKASVSIPDTVPSLWPWQDAAQNRFNINDAGPPVADLKHPTMAPIAINRDGSLADNSVVLTCFKSMTWVIENKSSASKVAVINLKLHDYGKTPSGETEVQFRLTRVTLEPMLKSMAYISQQLSTPANRVAVINLKLQDTKTTSGEAEVKFQVSRDTLGSMLSCLLIPTMFAMAFEFLASPETPTIKNTQGTVFCSFNEDSDQVKNAILMVSVVCQQKVVTIYLSFCSRFLDVFAVVELICDENVRSHSVIRPLCSQGKAAASQRR
ncbi:UNVERIFIED_CONTAM: protein FAR1-RELATED SEQUENCE 3 [Sesamum radiatum]|uniref:Protein FAR1-RELATED SEQUENCE n=1 Tax=Sesamum radiatum TaxID=300843 RepID=A0AAW2VM35_SESRA